MTVKNMDTENPGSLLTTSPAPVTTFDTGVQIVPLILGEPARDRATSGKTHLPFEYIPEDLVELLNIEAGTRIDRATSWATLVMAHETKSPSTVTNTKIHINAAHARVIRVRLPGTLNGSRRNARKRLAQTGTLGHGLPETNMCL